MPKAIVNRIFAHPIFKFLWLKLSLLLFRRSSLPEFRPEFDHMVWGDASRNGIHETPPKIIWSYWNGEKSLGAEACTRSWAAHENCFSIRILSPDTIGNYLPDFPKLPPGIPEQNISDLIRLMLLERYGGIWMDYSTIITQPLNWVIKLIKDNHCEALAFYNEHPNEYHKDHTRPIIENGFLAATPNSQFIKDWRSIYQECIQSADHRSFFRKKDDFDDLIRNFICKDIEYIDYFVCYIAAQHVMSRGRDYRLFLINAEHEYYFTYYNVSPPRNKRKFSEELLLASQSHRHPPRLIKIPGGHRTRIDEYIRHKCVRKHSILGHYL